MGKAQKYKSIYYEGMLQHDFGDFILVSDYEALEAKLDAATECINELQKELDENRTTHSMNLAEKLRLSLKRNAELEAQLSGYSSATPSYVKGLEAEVARYKSNIDTTEAATGMSGIYAKLEAEIARLRKAAFEVCLCRMNYSKRGVNPALAEYQVMMQSITALAELLKALEASDEVS